MADMRENLIMEIFDKVGKIKLAAFVLVILFYD